MDKSIHLQRAVVFFLIGIVIGLPLVVGLYVWNVLGIQPKNMLERRSSSVPRIDQVRYDALWQKVSLRSHAGSTPSASLDVSGLSTGRSDPFRP